MHITSLFSSRDHPASVRSFKFADEYIQDYCKTGLMQQTLCCQHWQHVFGTWVEDRTHQTSRYSSLILKHLFRRRTKAFIPSYKSVANVCSQKVTACLMSAFVVHRWPARWSLKSSKKWPSLDPISGPQGGWYKTSSRRDVISNKSS
jgi:hypothetical protein